MKKYLISLAAVFILYSVFINAQPLPANDIDIKTLKKQTPLKILCLGDSITKGGYRQQLGEMLTEAEIPFDLRLDAEGGRRLVWMLKNEDATAKKALEANPEPDIILLLIGINDLIENRNTVENTISRMSLLLNELKEYAPDAMILVGSLIPNAADDPVKDPSGYDPEKNYVNSEDKVLHFNQLLPGLVESKKTQGLKAAFVDLHSSMTRYNLADGIHPNKAGYDKIASAWFKAIMVNAYQPGISTQKRVLQHRSTYIVETFTGPTFDLPYWTASGADTDGFNGKGQFKIVSPYRGLRRIVGKGSFESLFELTNIDLKNERSTIELGFVPRDPKSKVILNISPVKMSLLFRDLESEPPIDQKYDNQALFEKPFKSIKLKITWNQINKQWRFFYGIDGNEPNDELPQSKKGLYFTKDLDPMSEALVSTSRGSADVDHFEFGPAVKGSQYYNENPPTPIGPVKQVNFSGDYYHCGIALSPEQNFAGADFELWIPKNVPELQGIIVRQHGAGGSGIGFAHDLQFQALAAKHRFALMGTFMKATENFRQWTDPQKGSGPAFIKALEILAQKSNHAELNSVPWLLWGHSAGGHWVNYMAREYPGRAIMLVSRSGHGSEYTGYDLDIPNLQILGEKEVDPSKEWYMKLITFGNLRAVAVEPGVGHACSNSRFLAVAFFEAVLDDLKKNNQKPLERKNGWLGDIKTFEIAHYDFFKGDKAKSYWLVNENFARKWKLFMTNGNFSDKTPPPAPFNLTIEKTGSKVLLKWKALADVETGIKQFNICRDGKLIAVVPGQSWNRGDEPDPVDCAMQCIIDITEYVKDGKTSPCTYSVSTVNCSEMESAASVVKADF